MPRVKRGKNKNKKRRKILKETKGYRWHRKNKKKAAKQALMKAWSYAFRDRRKKKGDFRRLWNIRINAATRQHGLKYSKFIHLLKENDIKLNRKVLSDMAKDDPEEFKKIVDLVKE